MKKHWIEYRPAWIAEPMTHWVHIKADGKPWYEAARFDPPAPKPVPGKGYVAYFDEIDGFIIRFASLDELDVCIDTLGKRVLPTSMRLSAERGTGYGPNNHWIGRLPGKVKSWRYRQKAVKYLNEAKRQFLHETRL